MKRILLTINGKEILGSDGLMHIDGRFNLTSIKREVRERNKRLERNFPHKVCDGFFFAGEHLNPISNIITL